MQYVYKCKAGHVAEVSYPMGEQPPTLLCECGADATRFYRAEGKRLNGMAQMKMERDPSYDPTLFLPTKKDFAGPGDPDGEKGMNQWMEDHRPADSSNGAKMVDPRKL